MAKNKPIGKTWVNWVFRDIIESGNETMNIYQDDKGAYVNIEGKRTYLHVVHEDDGLRGIIEPDISACITIEDAKKLGISTKN